MEISEPTPAEPRPSVDLGSADVREEPPRRMMDPPTVADCLSRLGKVSGQVNGVARMIDQDRYCVDVLNQITAAQKALDAVGRQVMHNYLRRCVTQAIRDGDPLIYDEIMRVIDHRRS